MVIISYRQYCYDRYHYRQHNYFYRVHNHLLSLYTWCCAYMRTNSYCSSSFDCALAGWNLKCTEAVPPEPLNNQVQVVRPASCVAKASCWKPATSTSRGRILPPLPFLPRHDHTLAVISPRKPSYLAGPSWRQCLMQSGVRIISKLMVSCLFRRFGDLCDFYCRIQFFDRQNQGIFIFIYQVYIHPYTNYYTYIL